MNDPAPGGLTTEQASALLAQWGKNELAAQKKPSFFRKLLGILKEPMFVLLIAASIIYFVLGETRDGALMLVFVLGIIGIDAVQGWKTDKTLRALKDLSAPQATVLRDGAEVRIPSAELVPGDWLIIQEGVKLPADGTVLYCSDLCVDESSLTGESQGVWKTPGGSCFAGTLVTQGSATLRVEQTGPRTEYGKIGAHVTLAPEKKTPLQQIGRAHV